MKLDFGGKRVLVTGAASGIGAGVARSFNEAGASVLLADLDGERAEKVAAELCGKAIAATCDVSVATDVEMAVQRAVDAFGGLDIVVNNAGVDYVAPFLEHDEDSFDRVIAVNLRGVFLGIKYGGRALQASGGGTIVNISSLAGLGALPLHAAYGASKTGVIALTQVAALELRAVGIRVNAVCPGIIHTPLLEAAGPQFEATTGMVLTDIASQFQGRLGTPDDIAPAVMYLASDQASLVSGVALPVDGAISAKGM